MAGKIREGFRFQMDDGTMKGLGVDDDGILYWDGKPVEIKKKISFGWLVNSAAVVAALATCVQAAVAVMTYMHDVSPRVQQPPPAVHSSSSAPSTSR